MAISVFRSREHWKPINWHSDAQGRYWVTLEAVNDGFYLGQGEFYSSMRNGARCIVHAECYHGPNGCDDIRYSVATLEYPENSEHREHAGPWLSCYDGLGYKGFTRDKWPILVVN